MRNLILISIQLLLISVYLETASANFRRVGKVSPSKIIFRNEDHEPLLPRPTFSPNLKPPRFGLPPVTGGPSKKVIPIPRSPPPNERKRPVISRTTSEPKKITPRPVPPQSIHNPTRTTTPKVPPKNNVQSATTSASSISKSTSNSKPATLEEPVIEGSFYVPFKMTKMHNGTRTS